MSNFVHCWLPVYIGQGEKTDAMEVPNGIIFRHECYDGGEGNNTSVAMVFVPSPRGYLKKWLTEEQGEKASTKTSSQHSIHESINRNWRGVSD